MRDEYLPGINEEYINKLLSTAPDSPQALVISAFLDDMKRWDEKLKATRTYGIEVTNKIRKYNSLIIQKSGEIERLKNICLKESQKLFVKIINSFGIRTRSQKRIDFVKNEIINMDHYVTELYKILNDTLTEYDKLEETPPNIDQYELAMIGNTLFKPR